MRNSGQNVGRQLPKSFALFSPSAGSLTGAAIVTVAPHGPETVNAAQTGDLCLGFRRAIGKKTEQERMLLGSPGIATRSKDATRASWPYY